MYRKHLLIGLLLIGLMTLSGVSLAFAQDSLLNFESDRRFGEISDTQPIAFYAFNGGAGDLVVAQVIGLAPGMTPTVALNSPSGRQVTFIQGAAGQTGSTTLSHTLTEPGLYTLQVSMLPGTPRGSFVLAFNGYNALQFVDLPPSGVALNLIANSAPSLFRFVPSADSAVTLNLAGENFIAEVYGDEGEYAGTVANPPLQNTNLTLPGGGLISVLIFAGGVDGAVFVSYGTGTGPTGPSAPPQPQPQIQPTQPPVVPPVATEEVSAPTGSCTVTGTGVNVRSGPGTNFNIVATLNGSASVIAVAPGNWYQILAPSGYISGTVVGLSGDCSSLPSANIEGPSAPLVVTSTPVTDPVGPTNTPPVGPTNTPPVGPTNTPPVGPTNTPPPPPTLTPTYTPPPPTATPTEVAVFPASPTQFLFEISRDYQVGDTVTFSQNLSSPGWHLVRVRVPGLSNQPGNLSSREFTMVLSCVSDTLRWGSGGTLGATPNTCNQAHTHRFTFDNNTSNLSIKLEGGPGVTYTIIATRIS